MQCHFENHSNEPFDMLGKTQGLPCIVLKLRHCDIPASCCNSVIWSTASFLCLDYSSFNILRAGMA